MSKISRCKGGCKTFFSDVAPSRQRKPGTWPGPTSCDARPREVRAESLRSEVIMPSWAANHPAASIAAWPPSWRLPYPGDLADRAKMAGAMVTLRHSRLLSIATLVAGSFMAGCTTSKFTLLDENEYQLEKMSQACSIGSTDAVLDELREEAVRFCAGRRERPVEIRASKLEPIPAIQCAVATLVFGCKPLTSKK